jgi:DNA relaxase NicK
LEFQPQTSTDLAVIDQPVILIDWLTFVDHLHSTPQDVMSFLGLPENRIPWVYSQKFRNGYPEHYFWHNITISFGADNERWYDSPSKVHHDMGICVNFSGQGCRAFESEGGDWLNLFKRFQGDLPTKLVAEMPDAFVRAFKERKRFNITRLDLAFDDHNDMIDIHRIAYDVRDRNYVSKSTYSEILWSDNQESDIQGISVGIGSKRSDVYIRIYDKAAERGFKDRHWVRVELQLRHDRAIMAMAHFLHTKHIGIVFSGVLRNYITFRSPSFDSNKSRWPIAYYWQRVLGQMEKISLWIKPGEPYNIHKSETWLKKQYGQLISTLSEIQDPGDLVRSCREIFPEDRLAKKYRQIISDFRRQQPSVPATITYYNGGIGINGEYHPYEQMDLEECNYETPWD